MDSKRNMGKDDIYQNKRGDINGDQFAFNAQRDNHRMEEEELRLLSSLGLTKEDIIDKTDPDLGTTRSAEAMLRSIERQRQYKQRVIEAARRKRETGKDIVIEQEDSNKERDIERILKYRCEQMSATRLNGVSINNSQVNQDFKVVQNVDNKEGLFLVTLLDNVVNATPQPLKESVDLLIEVDKALLSNVLLDIDEQTGKVNQILNHDEIIKQWDQCKDSLRKKYDFIRKEDTRDKLEYFLKVAEEQAHNLDSLSMMFNAKLFVNTFFDKYLVTDKNLFDPYKRVFNSQLFEDIAVELDFTQEILKESPNMVLIQRKSKMNKDTLPLSQIKEAYEKKFQPTIQYKFSDYNYSMVEKYVINTKYNFIVQSDVLFIEEVTNNLEVVTDFKLRKLV